MVTLVHLDSVRTSIWFITLLLDRFLCSEQFSQNGAHYFFIELSIENSHFSTIRCANLLILLVYMDIYNNYLVQIELFFLIF